jgi:hypothetical protein
MLLKSKTFKNNLKRLTDSCEVTLSFLRVHVLYCKSLLLKVLRKKSILNSTMLS